MKLPHFFLLIITLCLCVLQPQVSAQNTMQGSNSGPRAYPAQGVLLSISPDQHQAKIHHQTIPDYMMEMTMDLNVKDSSELKGLVPGDKITFTLNVTADSEWIDHLVRVGHDDQALKTWLPAEERTVTKLKPGDLIPDGEMITEDGRTIHFSDFRGKVLVFTFFFTRCPLPDYCPLMNKDFAKTRDLLLATPGLPDNWQLLSLSFDQKIDTPETLTRYSRMYRGNNPAHWLYAVATRETLAKIGPQVGLILMEQNSTISHNLRTIVVDPKGRLFCQFNDNQWTAEELAKAVKQAMLIQDNAAR